ncbi:unnamed protein product [Aureobasidium mustum]|uniref:Uncharacterized protein n=1 Tax=Aureobasidium mustum TaxID=2773714 RepID=A0A9N8JU97_9PEZI|nr:unnamed protein product [Aureobasidium mustum]
MPSIVRKEISRYFVADGIRPGDDNAGQRRHTPPLDTSRVARDVQTASPVVSDLLQKPFLGFGSRGSHPPTTSYYSWSESGKASSARVAHFAQDIEPLAAGQLQSDRVQQQMESIPLEQNTAQRLAAERVARVQHSKSHDPILEPVQEISQTTRLPVKPQTNQEVEIETTPVPISDKHETSVPAATRLVDQSEREWHGPNRTLPADAAMPTIPNDNVPCRNRSRQPELAVNSTVKQYSEPWEELLQNCELATRPSVPTYYDEDLPRYNSPVVRGQRLPDVYNHANLPLWRADVDQFPEYDFPDNTAFMSEHVHWPQPEVIEYQDDNVSFLGETIDEVSESLDSQDEYELATEDAVEWDADDAGQYDEVQDYQIRNDEAVDNFAMFWQPNKLY